MENADQILDAPQVETMQLVYAGFWVRTAAYILDGILLAVVNFLLGLVLAEVVPNALESIIEVLLGACYFSLMEASENQATLGKMALGLKVGDHNGDTITLANAFGRYFAKIVSALILCIGFMMVGWDPKCQGLHDKMANTYVFFRK